MLNLRKYICNVITFIKGETRTGLGFNSAVDIFHSPIQITLDRQSQSKNFD